MKDAVATMGGILPPDAGGRDAVHVAVFSATCKRTLWPGADVGILLQPKKVGGDTVVTDKTNNPVGIIDPFLKTNVKPRQRFWVYLYPRTITALSHRWSHPAFEAVGTSYAPPSQKLESERWLQNWCEQADCPGYDVVMDRISKILDIHEDMSIAQKVARALKEVQWDDEYIHFDGEDAHGEIPDEFWDHVQNVFGVPIHGQRPKYFSCSC